MEKVAKPQSGVSAEISELPVLPLRDVVVYPHMVIPLFVGREVRARAGDGDGGRQAHPARRAAQS